MLKYPEINGMEYVWFVQIRPLNLVESLEYILADTKIHNVVVVGLRA